jgi:hypothetical protein
LVLKLVPVDESEVAFDVIPPPIPDGVEDGVYLTLYVFVKTVCLAVALPVMGPARNDLVAV